MSKNAFIFPGQGAQYVGMGKDFYENFTAAKQTVENASDVLKKDLKTLIFEGPKEELTATNQSQVAIFVISVAILKTIEDQLPEIVPAMCGGLSLGEYTALYAARKISFDECLHLVQERGNLMQEACVKHAGTMRVVLGLSPEKVADIVEGKVWVANLNCPGQVVISGTVEGMEKVTEPLKEAGAKRVLPLDVAGAFHSGLMQSAKERLAPSIETVTLIESDIELVMNVPGDFVSDVGAIRKNLIEQVTSSVLWQKGIESMEKRKVEQYVEIGCGATLTGMNRKIGVKAATINVDKIEDLEKLSCIKH